MMRGPDNPSYCYFETGDEEKAQGWCAAYADINGDGRIDTQVDRRIQPIGVYSVSVSACWSRCWTRAAHGLRGWSARSSRHRRNRCARHV